MSTITKEEVINKLSKYLNTPNLTNVLDLLSLDDKLNKLEVFCKQGVLPIHFIINNILEYLETKYNINRLVDKTGKIIKFY